jgi:hypothetical protein
VLFNVDTFAQIAPNRHGLDVHMLREMVLTPSNAVLPGLKACLAKFGYDSATQCFGSGTTLEARAVVSALTLHHVTWSI